ncbi:hypothetical protein MKZ07_23260 [Paenibacillus sp. FSL P4-0338]|uniref:hypothetical protein n=1 Tax=Paenibacillus sp. FSL P4-0338 TaxID=2921635 RepID=UPI0030FAFE13
MDKELSPEAIIARRQYNRDYMRKWRQRPENKDKEKAYEKKRWERYATRTEQ